VLDATAATLAQLGADFPADGLEAGLDADLSDAGAHRPEPDDSDAAKLPRHPRQGNA
jgi:hypothetical protein